jgi:hypothetical protein
MKTFISTMLIALGLLASAASAGPYYNYNGDLPQWAEKALAGSGN